MATRKVEMEKLEEAIDTIVVPLPTGRLVAADDMDVMSFQCWRNRSPRARRPSRHLPCEVGRIRSSTIYSVHRDGI